MISWDMFEDKCARYLNEKFGNFAFFRLLGGSDSTMSDILVEKNRRAIFFIEVKEKNSQCGQFVLTPVDGKFIFAIGNKNRENEYARIIINEMDKNFDVYKDVGTAGITVSFPNDQEVFSKWIQSVYKNKNAHFIITDGYKIIPLENLIDCFNIKCKYRVKKSGSSSVGKSHLADVENFVSDIGFHYDCEAYDDKLIVFSNADINKQKFNYKDNEYMFSAKENYIYEVRKLSKTKNANVIFSLSLKDDVKGMSDEDFIKYLSSF